MKKNRQVTLTVLFVVFGHTHLEGVNFCETC